MNGVGIHQFRGALLASLVRFRVVIILIATLLVAMSFVPSFIDARTLSLGLDRAATMGILAVGVTVVLLLGQLDLSIGSILALSGIAAVGLQPVVGQGIAALLGVGLGLVCGMVNGFLVAVLKINSLVATLATMIFFRAACHLITDSRPISGVDPYFGIAFTRPLAGVISLRALIFIVAIILLHVFLTRTVLGREILAVGSNADSAKASGIRANRVTFGAFVFSGLTAGVGGVIFSVASNTGSPVFGETLVLTTIAAVVIGGTRLEGGVGTALGSFGGVLTLAALTTAMEYQGVPSYIQDIVTGLILLMLILLDRLTAERQSQALSLTQLKSAVTHRMERKSS